jgi:F-type H+-transporting ATPase subunit c
MKFVKTAALAFALLFVSQLAAHAQGEGAATAPGAATEAALAVPNTENIGALFDLRGVGVGLVIIGAGLGIGALTKSALESMARQPEILAQIQTAMIISAALIEGVSFFALIIIAFLLK